MAVTIDGLVAGPDWDLFTTGISVCIYFDSSKSGSSNWIGVARDLDKGWVIEDWRDDSADRLGRDWLDMRYPISREDAAFILQLSRDELVDFMDKCYLEPQLLERALVRDGQS